MDGVAVVTIFKIQARPFQSSKHVDWIQYPNGFREASNGKSKVAVIAMILVVVIVLVTDVDALIVISTGDL